MDKYDQIVELLELGTLAGVAVQSKNGWWKVFTSINHNKGLEGHHIDPSITGSMLDGLSPIPYYEEEIEEDFTKNIVPIPRKPKILPVGTKVRVLEIARKISNSEEYHSKIEAMTSKTCKIINFDDSLMGVNYHLSLEGESHYPLTSLWFPAHCLVPVYEEEQEPSEDLTDATIMILGDAEITVKEMLEDVQKGGKITVIKNYE